MNRTFYGCSSVTELNFTSNIEIIGNQAFANCIGLLNINFYYETEEGNTLSSLKTIEGYAFQNCRNVINLVVPNTVTEIDEGAFNNMVSLDTITLPLLVRHLK